MATPFTEVQLVQKLTTTDTTVLPVSEIESYLLEFQYKKRWAKIYTVVSKILEATYKNKRLWKSIKIDQMELSEQNIDSVIKDYAKKGSLTSPRVMG